MPGLQIGAQQAHRAAEPGGQGRPGGQSVQPGIQGGGRRAAAGGRLGSGLDRRGHRRCQGPDRGRRFGPRPQQPRPAAVDGAAPNESPADAERRRRNRHRRKPRGERVEASGSVPIQQPITAEIPVVTAEAPFFARLKQKLKQIVQRLPMPGRRR